MNTTKEPNHLLEEYIKQMTEKENKAYEIAKSHLGTSFDLKKSNGYLDWFKKKPIDPIQNSS